MTLDLKGKDNSSKPTSSVVQVDHASPKSVILTLDCGHVFGVVLLVSGGYVQPVVGDPWACSRCSAEAES